MSVAHFNEHGNPVSLDQTPGQIAAELQEHCGRLQKLIVHAAEKGGSFNEAERGVWDMLLKTGRRAMDLFVRMQGDGDLGEQVEGEDQKMLRRSQEKAPACVRSVFGEHHFQQYVYSPGRNKKISLRPVSARMQLPEHRWSYMLQEFSQCFCVDQAFNQAADSMEKVFAARFSVDTLEQTCQRMGVQAGAFLDELPTPAARDEATLLVASADCKGVPLVREDAAQVAAFETAKKRPGNRRMATVTCAYTVEPFVRTAREVVDALFRDRNRSSTAEAEPRRQRPRPQNKHVTAHFPVMYQDGDEELAVSGIHEGLAWLAEEVAGRTRTKTRALVVVMDGQESLWDVAHMHFGQEELLVEVLDIIHVSSYVWEASSLLCDSKQERQRFTRDRLLRILDGGTAGVIRGLRRMGSLARLTGEKRNRLHGICGYFRKHLSRMRYDEYLAAGYPVASGPVEGACGHLVKDRMERSGMRWTLEGARSMLHVRALFQSDYWEQFHEDRIATLTGETHPHRHLTTNYQPLSLAS